MRELDDPENPYLDSYEPWDLWMYLHEQSVLEALGVLNPRVRRDGWDYFYMKVDEHGFPVPRLVELRADYERMKHGRAATADEPECTHSIIALGVMDYGLQQRMQAAEDALLAEYMPAIPAWLVRSPPRWAMILDGGEVVTRGEVENSGWAQPGGMLDDPEVYCRYTAEGRLAGVTEPGQFWQQLFWDVEAVLEEYAGREVYYGDSNGYLVVTDRGSGRRLAVYDLDGTRLPPDHPLDDRDGTHFHKLYSGMLLRAYNAQRQARGRST